jgi:hypothetical protein
MLVGSVLSASAAQATGIVAGSQVKVLNVAPKGSLGGGTFSIDGPDAGNVVDFLTFCLEINEFINYGATYFVDLQLEARDGGLGGGTPDPLDSRTAYLYFLFAQGWLPGFDLNNVDHIDGLQLAIWRIEQEAEFDNNRYERWGTNTKITDNAAKMSKANEFYDLANNEIHNASLYGVKVMQMWESYNPDTKTFSGHKQDQLIFVSEATTTAALLMFGLVVLGVARARFGTL